MGDDNKEKGNRQFLFGGKKEKERPLAERREGGGGRQLKERVERRLSHVERGR